MASTLLSGHQLVATADIDQAREEVARRFCPHFLSLTRRDSRLDMVHNAAAIGEDVTLNYMRYGDEVRITPGAFDDFFLVQIPLAGTARVKVGDQVVASDRHCASLGSPTESVDMIWSDGCEQLLIYIRRRAVEELAAHEPGNPRPVVFQPRLDLDAPAVRAWLRLARLALDELEADGALFRSPLTATNFEQTLISGLLDSQPNSAVEQSSPPAVSSRAVRRALQLIDGEPGRAWRVADLAEQAGVSVRALQESFRRDLGVTPLEQVRRTRLERARRDLLAADRGAVSVTDIAARWGFFHLGRFSQAYRSAYQELPSQTLEQSLPVTRKTRQAPPSPNSLAPA